MLNHPKQTGVSDGRDQPPAPAHDRRHDDPQSVAGEQQSYLYAVAKFSRHFGRSPDRLDLEEVRAYQLHLIAQQRSWSHINQTVCALRFFYGVTLGWTDALERIVAAREPQKLPVVLSAAEIVRFLEAVPGLRNRAALTTAYAAGLRIGEFARLATGAIDSHRMLIRIEHSKGSRPRSSITFGRTLKLKSTEPRLILRVCSSSLSGNARVVGEPFWISANFKAPLPMTSSAQARKPA